MERLAAEDTVMGSEPKVDTEEYAIKHGFVREQADRNARLYVAIAGAVLFVALMVGLFAPNGISRWWRWTAFLPLTMMSIGIMWYRGM